MDPRAFSCCLINNKEVYVVGKCTKCIIHLIREGEVCDEIVDIKEAPDIHRLLLHLKNNHGILANEVKIAKLQHVGWDFLMQRRSTPGPQACPNCALYVTKNDRNQAMAKHLKSCKEIFEKTPAIIRLMDHLEKDRAKENLWSIVDRHFKRNIFEEKYCN